MNETMFFYKAIGTLWSNFSLYIIKKLENKI